MKMPVINLHALDDDNLIAIARYCGDTLALELAERLETQRDVHAGVYENVLLSGHEDCEACGETATSFSNAD